MIVFKLNCKSCDFDFEGWFDNSKEFEKQKKLKLISCPSCNSLSVKKSLMAPNVAKKTNSKNLKTKKAVINKIEKYKKIIEKNYDYVGDNFTEEAKKIKLVIKNKFARITMQITSGEGYLQFYEKLIRPNFNKF